MQDQSKDVEIGGVRYQIGRFTARDGSWILLQIAPKISKALTQARDASESEMLMLSFITGVIDEIAQTAEDTFRRIQEHALAVCRRYENGAPMPVFVRPNTWAIKELEYDLVTVMALTVQALVFNLTPFFSEGGFQQMLSALTLDSKPALSPN